MMPTMCQVQFLAPGEIVVNKDRLTFLFLFCFDTSKQKIYTHAHRVKASLKKKEANKGNRECQGRLGLTGHVRICLWLGGPERRKGSNYRRQESIGYWRF